MVEDDGGRERGGPKGSGRPLTFMALIAPLLLLLLLLWPLELLELPVLLLAVFRPREAESYSECLRSGSLLERTGSLSLWGGTVVGGVRPTGGRLVLEPPS